MSKGKAPDQEAHAHSRACVSLSVSQGPKLFGIQHVMIQQPRNPIEHPTLWAGASGDVSSTLKVGDSEGNTWTDECYVGGIQHKALRRPTYATHRGLEGARARGAA